MSFDLKRCMEVDDGKCIFFSNGKDYPCDIVYDNYSYDKNYSNQLVGVIHRSKKLFDDIRFFDRTGHYTEGSDVCLRNLPVTYKVFVYILLSDVFGRYPYITHDVPYSGNDPVMSSKMIEMVEGEFVEFLKVE